MGIWNALEWFPSRRCFKGVDPVLENAPKFILIDKEARSISRTLSKVEGEVHGHEKASKRLASLQAMRPVMARRDAAPAPDITRDKVREIERHSLALQPRAPQQCRYDPWPQSLLVSTNGSVLPHHTALAP